MQTWAVFFLGNQLFAELNACVMEIMLDLFCSKLIHCSSIVLISGEFYIKNLLTKRQQEGVP